MFTLTVAPPHIDTHTHIPVGVHGRWGHFTRETERGASMTGLGYWAGQRGEEPLLACSGGGHQNGAV